LPGMTPEALMRSCANLSGLQRAAFAEPLKGSRLQFTGPATIITPAPIGGVNMTMVLQGDDQNFDAFLHFPGDVEALSRLRVNEQITVEGQLKSIELGTINFDQCRLLSSTEQREPRRFDPATVEKPWMHEAIAAARAETAATARAPVPLSAPERPSPLLRETCPPPNTSDSDEQLQPDGEQRSQERRPGPGPRQSFPSTTFESANFWRHSGVKEGIKAPEGSHHTKKIRAGMA